ncbi:aldehyde dehydrogenase family protein [Coxiella-like endosymbiont]|uniref:aldehyde dehydrogenase family protein n=1 Tax=Coxiella-like endosymbiont TaxID=1592897 RepID=UPI00272A7455|nr:aldehyde dehydrogenase family protein [Coxiella-like endosymbiont]
MNPGQRAFFNEEIFRPVIALIRAKDEEEAIELANDSKFGPRLPFLQKISHEARISPLEDFRLVCGMLSSACLLGRHIKNSGL